MNSTLLGINSGELMGEYLTSFLGLSLVAVVLAMWSSKRKGATDHSDRQTLPPGPRGIPILGYRPFMTQEPYKQFVKLSTEYQSGIISLYLGNRFTVILNDFASVKEALLQDACLGRPHGTAFELLSDAISMNDVSGPLWRENRRTTVRILKELGFDKAPMDAQVRYEVHELVEYLKSHDGQTLDFHNRLTSSVSNNITALVFGDRMNFDDHGRRLLDDYILTISTFFNQTSLHACFPWLKKVLYFFKVMDYDKAKFQLRRFLGYVQDEIEAHQATMDEGGERSKDYIEGYLKSMSKVDSPSSPYLSIRLLRGNIRSLFGAGTEPVRCTLEWCFLTMAHFQDYQSKVHQELDAVLGGQAPGFSDSPATPMTQAIIYEVTRWLGVVPFSHVRSAMKDTTIQGHFVPKDSVILMNFYAVHHQQNLWSDPEDFRPERFIVDGKTTRPEYFLPFGFGKRSCPGEAMVYIELYVYFATIMQNFTIRPPEGESVSFDAVLGIAKQAKSPRLRFLHRQS